MKIHTAVQRAGELAMDGPIISLGEMAPGAKPGAKKDIGVTCTDGPNYAVCGLAFAQAWLTDDLNNPWRIDANHSNNAMTSLDMELV